MNWRAWLHGLIAAIISGAGNGLAAVVIGVDLAKVKLMILVSMAISAGLYLKQSPLPPEREIWTDAQRAAQTSKQP